MAWERIHFKVYIVADRIQFLDCRLLFLILGMQGMKIALSSLA